MEGYDPFDRGPFPAGVRTIHATDPARERDFRCEIWLPAAERHAGQDTAAPTRDSFTDHNGVRRSQAAVRDAQARPGAYPLVLFSHQSGGHRRAATFLCTHLASHGYVVAALDHSETIAPELSPREGETDEQRSARAHGWVANRVPDLRFLLDHMLSTGFAPTGIGVIGHSFGGWTALALPEVDTRVDAVVAMAPGGSSDPKPGVIPLTLTFAWGRDVPTLYLVAEDDTPLPLDGMYELFDRTPTPKQIAVLRRADHQHFVDNAEEDHETWRTNPLPGPGAWMSQQMRPFGELCPAADAQLFARGLALSHLDASVKGRVEAQRFLTGDLAAELARRGVDAFVRPGGPVPAP